MDQMSLERNVFVLKRPIYGRHTEHSSFPKPSPFGPSNAIWFTFSGVTCTFRPTSPRPLAVTSSPGGPLSPAVSATVLLRDAVLLAPPQVHRREDQRQQHGQAAQQGEDGHALLLRLRDGGKRRQFETDADRFVSRGSSRATEPVCGTRPPLRCERLRTKRQREGSANVTD